MGKKQHQKDRLFLTAKEHKEEWGGYKEKKRAPFARLPFYCCALTFTPFEDAVCTDDGTVFDIVNIVPYIKKYGRHPVKGTPLQLADLIQLNFHKNADGEFCCPVTGKVFTEHTHIVAVKPTGNVYSWDAVDQLNVKPKNWKDLQTEEPFTRKDIITLQDPLNMSARLISDFDHVKKDLHVDDEGAKEGSSLRNVNEDMQRTLNALGTAEAREALARGGGGKRAEAARMLADARLKKPQHGSAAAAAAGGGGGAAAGVATAAAAGDWRLRGPGRSTGLPAFKPGAVTWDTEDHTLEEEAKKKKKGVSGAGAASSSANGSKPSPKEWYDTHHARYVTSHLTTGAMSRGFTSTVAGSTTKNERQMVRLERTPAKKGYARLHTSLGDVNVELHCDLAPRTCENWLALARMGYYDGTIFHRSIKNFMIQGGDPTGTGKGGESIYGPTFKDELDSRLLHAGRGVLSMANSGPNTNGSQFFITYKSAPHLNYKHSVFGRVVGGLDVVSLMEKVPTDDEDRPLQELSITGITVFADPFLELEQEEQKAAGETAKKADADNPANPENQRSSWYSNPGGRNAVADTEEGVAAVGKYLAPAVKGPASAAAAGDKPGEGAKPAEKRGVGAAAVAAAAKKQRTEMANFDGW